MQGPRADFACLSKKCRREDGAAEVFELPVSATRCPVCGSKRIQRLYNAVNIASGVARTVDFVAEPAMRHAEAVQASAREAEANARNPQRDSMYLGPSFAVPLAQARQMIGASGQGKAVALPRQPLPVMTGARVSPGRPKPERMLVDKEYTIKTVNGRPEMAKA